MADIRIEKLAELLVNYSVAVKEGDKVVIQSSVAAESLVKEVYSKVLQSGGHPFVLLEPNGLQEIFYQKSSDKQLKYVSDISKLITETFDVNINIIGTTNTKALSSVDPSKIVMHSSSRRGLREKTLERSANGQLRWVVTIFPTNAYAQDADMGLSEYEDFVYGACVPDFQDPIGYWRRFSDEQQRIIDWLEGKKEVKLIARETELTLSIEGRNFINCDGHINMPDGEIFTGPVENSINGHVYFSYPSIYSEREVIGIRLWFENGRVIKATAEKNEEFLIKTLDTDEGSRYVGEFAIGTNEGITRYTREILFDEKINGSFHLALGIGYPESGSVNKSAIHWDMICDLKQGGEIWVDDVMFYKEGEFII